MSTLTVEVVQIMMVRVHEDVMFFLKPRKELLWKSSKGLKKREKRMWGERSVDYIG